MKAANETARGENVDGLAGPDIYPELSLAQVKCAGYQGSLDGQYCGAGDPPTAQVAKCLVGPVERVLRAGDLEAMPSREL